MFLNFFFILFYFFLSCSAGPTKTVSKLGPKILSYAPGKRFLVCLSICVSWGALCVQLMHVLGMGLVEERSRKCPLGQRVRACASECVRVQSGRMCRLFCAHSLDTRAEAQRGEPQSLSHREKKKPMSEAVHSQNKAISRLFPSPMSSPGVHLCSGSQSSDTGRKLSKRSVTLQFFFFYYDRVCAQDAHFSQIHVGNFNTVPLQSTISLPVFCCSQLGFTYTLLLFTLEKAFV